MQNRVAIVGGGYVGLTTAAIFANAGITTHMVDIDEKKIEVVKGGKSYFYEAGLDQLVASGLKKGTLLPTTSYEDAIPEADIVISCVGTPDNPDGSPNLKYIYDAARATAKLAKSQLIFVQKSTVPVGTGDALGEVFKNEFPELEVSYVSNPEFLRESSAIADTLFGDRVVVGGDCAQAVTQVVALYKVMDTHKKEIAATAAITTGAKEDAHEVKVVETSLKSAELIKVTANAFLALKISFANSIAKLADEAHADINEVMDGVGLDNRIGRAFLNAGRGYGGGCFPKDVSGLISVANDHGVDLHIMGAATEVNASMPGYIVNLAKEKAGSLEGKKVAVLGLAFKAGTSDARKSPAVAVANSLAHEKAEVRAYDPYANEEAGPDLNRTVSLVDTLDEATKDAELVFIATDWPEFKELDYSKLDNGSVKFVVDCMNALEPEKITKNGIGYLGVGRGKS